MKKWLLLFILPLLFSTNVFSQNISGMIVTTKGGKVKFHLNSVKRIMDGLTYTDYLELTIYYCDTNYLTAGWELYVSATNSEFIAALGSVPTVPLDAITITSRMEDGTNIAVNQPLQTSGLLIGEGLPPITPSKCVQDRVILSFTCTGLMGYSFDFYDTDLHFELKSK